MERGDGHHHGEDEVPVPEGELHAEVVAVARAELLLVADALYLVGLDLVVDDAVALGAGDGVGPFAHRDDDPVVHRRFGEAALERAALQEGELLVDLADDVPGAEVVDLLAGLGDELLGERPAAPAGAQAEDALGPGVEHHVGPLLGGELLQVLAELLGGLLARVAGCRLGDLGADAAAAEQGAPALAQLDGGPLDDAAGEEPADDRGHQHDAQVGRQDPGEGQPEHHEQGEEAGGDEHRGAQEAGAPVVGAGGEPAELDDAEPEQQAGQEEDPADERDQRQLHVPLPADAVGGEAVDHHRLGLHAEGLDEGGAGPAEHPHLDGAGEGLAEVGAEELVPLARGDLGLVQLVVGFQDLVDGAVAVRGGGEGVGRRRLPVRALEGDLRPETETVHRHCRPHRAESLCGLFPNCAAPHTF